MRTGEPAFDHVFGMSNFEYWEHDAKAGAIHDAFFRAMARTTSAPIVGAYDFSRFGTAVDVGGSTGALLAAILRAQPGAHGVLFDLPHVVSGAGPILAEAEVADRCAVVGGSFFESVPSGGDADILKQVIHDWDDERSVAILRRCCEAMALGGRAAGRRDGGAGASGGGGRGAAGGADGPADGGAKLPIMAHAWRSCCARCMSRRRTPRPAIRHGRSGLVPRTGLRRRPARPAAPRIGPCP